MDTQARQPVTLEQIVEQLSALCDKADTLFRRYSLSVSSSHVLTVAEVAERLAVKANAVERLIRTGQLPWVDVSVEPGSKKPRKRIKEVDLLAFIAARTVKPVSTNQPRRRRRRIIPGWKPPH